jgi:CheY-like chemotaxis protein
MVKPRKRVIVVDDAPWCGFTTRNARAAGFDVEEAMNGLEALEKLLTSPSTCSSST